MIIRREEYLQALAAEFKKSCQILSLPESVLLQLERFSEIDLDKRNNFINQTFKPAFLQLKQGEYCLVPSVFGVHYFNLVINVDGKIKKFTGVLKEDHVELQQYDGTLVRSNTLKECLERALLSFEKQGTIPILYEAHRGAVLDCAHAILESAIENNNFSKLKAAFTHLNLKEIDKSILLQAFSKASKEIVEFLVDKIVHHQVRLRQTSSREHNVKEKVEHLLFLARKRVAVGDEENARVGESIRDYIKQTYPDRLTEQGLKKERLIDTFFKSMAELADLKPAQQNFIHQRDLLEQKMNNILNEVSFELNLPVGRDRINPLDIALSRGSVSWVKTLLEKGAEPTVGFKYETVEAFKKGNHSALKYIIKQGHRSEQEENEINQLLEHRLLERDKKAIQDKLSQGSVLVLVENFGGSPKTHIHKPTRPL